MYILFVLASMIGAVVGFMALSQATFGVGVICLSILAAVWARLVQAHAYHRELVPEPPTVPNIPMPDLKDV